MGILVLVFSGCSNVNTVQGVDSPWEPGHPQDWQRGSTTQAEVLEVLGPPSQLIALQDGTVLYYLRERRKGNSVILLVYNTEKLKVEYDRAVFFFDKDGILTDYC